MEPAPELRDLHEQILAADARLAVAGSRAGGNERPRQAGRPAPGRTRAHRATAAASHRATFCRPDPELTELTWLAEPATVPAAAGTVAISVISGTAGIGKTALALHWAHQAAGRFPDGQLYVNLRGFDPAGTPVTPAEAIRGFLDALDVPAARIPPSLAGADRAVPQPAGGPGGC